jgi:hypothetical protein
MPEQWHPDPGVHGQGLIYLERRGKILNPHFFTASTGLKALSDGLSARRRFWEKFGLDRSGNGHGFVTSRRSLKAGFKARDLASVGQSSVAETGQAAAVTQSRQRQIEEGECEDTHAAARV